MDLNHCSMVRVLVALALTGATAGSAHAASVAKINKAVDSR